MKTMLDIRCLQHCHFCNFRLLCVSFYQNKPNKQWSIGIIYILFSGANSLSSRPWVIRPFRTEGGEQQRSDLSSLTLDHLSLGCNGLGQSVFLSTQTHGFGRFCFAGIGSVVFGIVNIAQVGFLCRSAVDFDSQRRTIGCWSGTGRWIGWPPRSLCSSQLSSSSHSLS